MPIPSDKEIKEAMKAKVIAGSGTKTRVLTRWKLTIDKQDWKGALRSLADDSKIDGWIITRKARTCKRVASFKWELKYTYTLWYFKSVREGTSSSNSEDEMNALLDSVAAEFEADDTMGFDSETSGVDFHEQLQVLDIDAVDDQVHIAQCELTVHLTKQP